MSRMKDEEIIKALELCSDTTIEDGHCKICPLKDACYGEEGLHALEKAALDLIQRQQKEIERLSNFVTEERCREIAKEYFKPIVKQLMAVIIKEFAEAVKLEFYKEFEEIIPSVMAERIDRLVKEMVGGSDDR